MWTMKQKMCYKCGELKNVTEFNYNFWSKKYNSDCKKCETKIEFILTDKQHKEIFNVKEIV